MPEAFVQGLNDNTRTQTIDLLNARLADVISLAMAVKQAHWNLRGAGFIGVHELLDDVADRLRESSDLIAERAVILGASPVAPPRWWPSRPRWRPTRSRKKNCRCTWKH